MVHTSDDSIHVPDRPERRSSEAHQTEAAAFPIQAVTIDWDHLIARRPLVLETVDNMPAYLLKPEVLAMLDAAKHPRDRLMLDLMWTTGARVSELLALRPSSFVDDGYDFGVVLNALQTRPGRPSKASLKRSSKRYVPIVDPATVDRVQSFLTAGRLRREQRLFPMARQTVNRHIQAVVKRAGGAAIPVSAHTFRHSFAIHLLLHGRPLKCVGRLLGHKSVESTEIYTNVLTIDGEHCLEEVDFH